MNTQAGSVEMTSLLNGMLVSQALHVLASLGVPDLLAGGPRSSEELADSAGAHPASLHAHLVFDTLYGLDQTMSAQPQMVEGHSVEDGGLSWTLRLRNGLRFHDGEPVQARDAVASIRRWAARDGLGFSLMTATAELSADDDLTLRFRLTKPRRTSGRTRDWGTRVHHAISEVGADQLRRAGLNVDLVSLDFPTLLRRSFNKEPPEKGGWNVYFTILDCLFNSSPATHAAVRADGKSGLAGWPVSPRLEALRELRLEASDLESRRRIAREMQMQFWQDVPYIPMGYWVCPTAHRRDLVDLPWGFAAFYGVRRV
jgi:ABC-type transport system substrate-binding protein